MYLLLIFSPLIGCCFSGLFGKQLGFLGSIQLCVYFVSISFIFSFIGFYEIILMKAPVFFELNFWVNLEIFFINWGFIFDSLTISMCFVVTFISCLVHIYSVEYMFLDPHLPRFMSYLSMFTFFMLILVTADNFLQMFIGWEGVGICSYLLINFWFTRIQANKAAIKAMVLNRIGDFTLVIGFLLIFVNFKSIDYSIIACLTPYFKNNFIFFGIGLLNSIGIFLFVGAIGKSAQLGLHTWLPDAMEAPTPVSALIHAATMVTAGVFLIIRVSFLYEYLFKILEILTIIGAMTSFMAATIGLFQNDLKKIVAYSTCSQLGYMVFACGLSNYSIAIFHLTNHAFFKAVLFLGAGSIIHGISDEQDIRKMGGLKIFLPFSYMIMLIGSLALIGFPFLTGFYSKDLILEISFSKYNLLGYFSYFLGSFGAFLTAFYSIRLIFLTFLSKPNGFKTIICYSKDSGLIIQIVLIVLAVPSLFVGYFNKDLIVGLGNVFFNNSVFNNLELLNIFDSEFIPSYYKILPVNFSLFGFCLAFLIYFLWSKFIFNIKSSNFGIFLYTFFNRKWFFDKMFNDYLGQFFFKFGYSISYKFLDRGFFEFLGPSGLSFIFTKFSNLLNNLQINFLYHLLFSILIGFSLLFFIKSFVFNYFFNLSLFILILILKAYARDF